MKICDRLLTIANEKATRPFELRYTKSGVSIGPPGAFLRVIVMWPKKEFVPVRLGLSNANDWANRLSDTEIGGIVKREDRLIVRLTTAELSDHEDVIRELVHQCVAEYEA